MVNIAFDEVKASVLEALAAVAPIIKFVGDHPETGYKEEKACAKQVEYLEKLGFAVEKGVADISTAFKGNYSAVASDNTINAALLTEYDALQPPMDHACGHQLIMGAGLLALTAVRNIMEKYQIPGTVQAIGCPAEEQLGGKVYMIRKDVFKHVNIALLSHPFFRNGVSRNILAVTHGDLEFFGKSAHASTNPEQGINALDAMTIFMNGINAWRQQLPKTARVHGIITNGGTAANVIPDYTAGVFYVRSDNNQFQKFMEKRFEEIAQGAALIAGCEYKMHWHDAAYTAGKPNNVLASTAEKIMMDMGLKTDLVIEEPLSTDFANVCDCVPGLNIYFDVTNGEPLALHSIPFREAAASEKALENTANAAAILAKIALDYLTNEEFRHEVDTAR